MTCDYSKGCHAISSLDEEEARLRKSAASGDAFSMAALGRFLRHKRGDVAGANEWQRRAVEAVSQNLSSNLNPIIRYS